MKLFFSILLLVVAVTGCSLLSPDTDYTQRGRDNNINDPRSNQILSYMLGSSVLVASISGIYYRNKACKK